MAGEPRYRPQREIVRIKMNIKRTEKERDRMFPVLGRATYQAHLEGKITEPDLVGQCDRIRDMNASIEHAAGEIAILQAQIDQAKQAGAQPQLACPHCGAPYAAGMKFCGSCGQVIAPPAAGQGMLTCPTCGTPITPGAAFCGECGAVLTASAAPEPPSPPAGPPVAAPPPTPATPAPPPPVVPVPPGPPPVQKADETAPAAGLKCPQCGAVGDEEGAAFCGECGAAL